MGASRLGVGKVRAAAREALLVVLEAWCGVILEYGPTLLVAFAGIGVTVGIVALTFALLEGLL